MAKITRYNGNLKAFASEQLTNERTLFGQTGIANDLTSQVTAQFLRGWGIIGPSDQPSLQDFNAAMYTNGQLLAYLHQMGVAEYNSTQEYFVGSLTQTGGVLYISLANANIGNTPSSSPASWKAFTADQATETVLGLVKIATQLIANAGVDDASAVSAKKLASIVRNQSYEYFNSSGSGTAYSISPIPAAVTPTAGQRFCVKFHVASGANPIIGISSLAAQNLKQYNRLGVKVSAVVATGQLSDIVYDGTDFIIMNPLTTGNDPWAIQPIGVPIPVMFGAGEPPTDQGYRYVKLTAGDAYNSGALTAESVTGSAPLVVAYGQVSVAGSPILGNTIYLINTERRYVRPGAGGTLQNDAVQNITGGMTGQFSSATAITMSGAFAKASTPGLSSGASVAGTGYTDLTFDASRVARADIETRTKNIGAVYYMRVL